MNVPFLSWLSEIDREGCPERKRQRVKKEEDEEEKKLTATFANEFQPLGSAQSQVQPLQTSRRLPTTEQCLPPCGTDRSSTAAAVNRIVDQVGNLRCAGCGRLGTKVPVYNSSVTTIQLHTTLPCASERQLVRRQKVFDFEEVCPLLAATEHLDTLTF